MRKNQFEELMSAMNNGFGQVNERMDAQDARMSAMEARIGALENGKGGKKSTSTSKGAPTREYEYVRKDGTVKMCTEKEYRFFMDNREKAEARANRTPEEVAKIKADNQKKSADADAAVCRKLEKAIGCKAGSIARSTITLADATALGFKGNRADLKALKAQCRAK